MSYTRPNFYDVQKKEKTKSTLLLIPLSVLYLIIVFLFFFPFKFFYIYEKFYAAPSIEWVTKGKPKTSDFISAVFHLSDIEMSVIGLIAVCFVLYNWNKTKVNFANHILLNLFVLPPNPGKLNEKIFQNTVEEMRISAGLPQIYPRILSTPNYNAFTLNDSKGRIFVVVTQGMVSDFKRNELQSVVAHELAHVIRGDSFYISFISLLIHSFIGKVLDTAILYISDKIIAIPYDENECASRNNENDQSLIDSYLYLIRPVVWAMRFFGCFISRKRELLADATAVGMTRNPFALACALYRADKGNSYLGVTAEAFNHLLMVAPRNRGIDIREGFLANLFSSHPPITKRLWILLIMANKSFSELYKKCND